MATTMNTADPGSPYRVPPEPSRMPAIVLAALVHAGLLLFLWIGVSWQNTEPVNVEAEVWDMKVQSAAAPPEPAPPPKPEPLPVPVKPEPPPPPPPKVVEQPVAPKPPDIALEREKKQKEQKLKQLAEQREEREREELKKQKLLDQKLQEKKLADAKRDLEKERKELAEQKKREQEAEDKKADEKKEQLAKEKADKLAKTKAAAAEQAKLDKLRDAEMRRLTGATGSGGEVQKSTAPRIDSGYLASIVSKIKSTTSYLGSTDVPGNPRAVFKIEELPTGEIISVKMVKSSGVPAFDDAVEKGIIKSSPLPKKKDGTVERTLDIGFSMKDLN